MFGNIEMIRTLHMLPSLWTLSCHFLSSLSLSLSLLISSLNGHTLQRTDSEMRTSEKKPKEKFTRYEFGAMQTRTIEASDKDIPGRRAVEEREKSDISGCMSFCAYLDP
jgi:hypothetical protein